MTNNRPIQEFLAEAEDILETAMQALIGLEDARAAGHPDADLVNGLFRALHTFKGLAGMFGLKAPADLAHKLENLLDEVRLGKVDLDRSALDALADVVGLLGRLVQQIGKDQPPEDIGVALSRIDE